MAHSGVSAGVAKVSRVSEMAVAAEGSLVWTLGALAREVAVEAALEGGLAQDVCDRHSSNDVWRHRNMYSLTMLCGGLAR